MNRLLLYKYALVLPAALLLAGIIFSMGAKAQFTSRPKNILFYQLNTLHGLSYNVINALCSDKNGNLWFGAGEGLNRFNGNTVTRYLNKDYPQLANNNIHGLVCNNDNRIWIPCDDSAAAMADANRRFRKVMVQHQQNINKNSKTVMHSRL